jgi:hypothetical protein|tara:strand:- start:2313 stop:3347 length:1035 start_codon:yes stop_codon:yes gene_type:complete
MRDLKNNHITYGKGSTNIQSKRTKSFGYQILGFGSGGGAAAQASFDYLVIAGGGATGGGLFGGGGAGGFRTSFPGGTKILVESGTTITVGAGGVAGTYPVSGADLIAGHGSDSIIAGVDVTLTSAGGGIKNDGAAYPGSPEPGPVNATVRDGGSGAGTGHQGTLEGVGNTPPVSPSQGNPGGPGGGSYASSGGGGAGGAGVNGVTPGSPSNNAGAGGPGTANTIAPAFPLGTTYAGGGGGGAYNFNGGAGGPGGGGAGGNSPANPGSTSGVKGTDGLGGGAGGAGNGTTSPNTFAGGSGVVFLRIATSSAPGIAVTPGTNTTATVSSDTVCTFTVPGTVTFGAA